MNIVQLALLDTPAEPTPPTYAPSRLAALALRWAAQLAAGETPELLPAYTRPLRDVGLNMTMMEFMARKWAAEALAMVDRAALEVAETC